MSFETVSKTCGYKDKE